MNLSKLKLDIPSKCERVSIKLSNDTSFELSIKREDLINPLVSGNKWRKLKGNIIHVIKEGFNGIISFGGAYSNHLYALGHVCAQLEIPLVTLIRGDGFDPDNSTLTALVKGGHEIHYIDRTSYKMKEKNPIIASIIDQYSNYFVIPEGGSNSLAKVGIYEMCDEINWKEVDHLWVSAGTGGTSAGILTYILHNKINCQLNVVSSLKGNFIEKEILQLARIKRSARLKVYNDFHFGGYGKMPIKLRDFANQWTRDTDIPVDLIYNAKTVFGLLSTIESNKALVFKNHLYINTGGRR